MIADKLAAAGSKPVLLFFGSPSCGPTLAMFPILDQFDEATEGEFIIESFSIDDFPDETKAYSIKSTPTTILIRDGEVLGTMAGTMRVEQMIEWVAGALAPKIEKIKRARKE